MWNCRQESDFYLILDPWITLIRFDKSRAWFTDEYMHHLACFNWQHIFGQCDAKFSTNCINIIQTIYNDGLVQDCSYSIANAIPIPGKEGLYIETGPWCCLVSLDQMRWLNQALWSPLITVSTVIVALGNGPLTRYVKLWVANAPGMPGTFSLSPTSKETTN